MYMTRKQYREQLKATEHELNKAKAERDAYRELFTEAASARMGTLSGGKWDMERELALEAREDEVKWSESVLEAREEIIVRRMTELRELDDELTKLDTELRELDSELHERLIAIEGAERSYTEIHQQYAALKFAIGGLLNYHNAHGSSRAELADDINKELETFHG